ncbi:hypothetical protein [Rubripirellula reticaptiva]|nr:hypothetical protein [Rubripirellula reticaptiva]
MDYGGYSEVVANQSGYGEIDPVGAVDCAYDNHMASIAGVAVAQHKKKI